MLLAPVILSAAKDPSGDPLTNKIHWLRNQIHSINNRSVSTCHNVAGTYGRKPNARLIPSIGAFESALPVRT